MSGKGAAGYKTIDFPAGVRVQTSDNNTLKFRQSKLNIGFNGTLVV